MPESQFEILYRLINQLTLETKEVLVKIEGKVDIMHESLKSCQKRCHVQNPGQEGLQPEVSP